MSSKFVCGSSPIRDRDGNTVGVLTYSGTETHRRLRRTFWDWLFGRPGKWVNF